MISENTAVDTRSGYAQGSIRDVDEYNRRYRWDNDSISAAEEEVAGQDSASTITTGKKGETINIRNEFFVSTPRPSALRSAVFILGLTLWSQFHILGCYMMMDFTHTLILAVGIGDLPSPTRGDGDYIILIGRGEVLGMPDGMILGIGDRTGIIRIGDIPVMDGIHQDRLLVPV